MVRIISPLIEWSSPQTSGTSSLKRGKLVRDGEKWTYANQNILGAYRIGDAPADFAADE